MISAGIVPNAGQLWTCGRCGCLVGEQGVGIHDAWHDAMEQAIAQAAKRG